MTQSELKTDEKAPSLISTGVETLVQEAGRLGLTWTLRPATVILIDPSPTSGLATITYDGDSTGVTAVSLIGVVTPGDRVMGLIIPPAGNFILSLPTSISRPYAPGRGVVGSHTEVVNQTGITTVVTIMTTDQTINFRTGRAYAWCMAHSHFSSGAGVLAQYTADLTNGGLGMHMGNHRTEGASSTGVWHSKIAVCTADISDTAILTAAAVSGNISILGSASAPREFWVEDVGPAELYQNFITF